MKILLAEQSRSTSNSLAFLLRGVGHEVDVAFDGIQALEMLTVGNHDVLLTELDLPRLSGKDVVDRSRKNGSKCFSIGMLNKSEISYVDLLDGHNVDVLLPKPFDVSALLDLLRSVQNLRPDKENSTKLGFFQNKILDELSEGEPISTKRLKQLVQTKTFGSIFDFIRAINHQLMPTGKKIDFSSDKGYKVISYDKESS